MQSSSSSLHKRMWSFIVAQQRGWRGCVMLYFPPKREYLKSPVGFSPCHLLPDEESSNTTNVIISSPVRRWKSVGRWLSWWFPVSAENIIICTGWGFRQPDGGCEFDTTPVAPECSLFIAACDSMSACGSLFVDAVKNHKTRRYSTFSFLYFLQANVTGVGLTARLHNATVHHSSVTGIISTPPHFEGL